MNTPKRTCEWPEALEFLEKLQAELKKSYDQENKKSGLMVREVYAELKIEYNDPCEQQIKAYSMNISGSNRNARCGIYYNSEKDGDAVIKIWIELLKKLYLNTKIYRTTTEDTQSYASGMANIKEVVGFASNIVAAKAEKEDDEKSKDADFIIEDGKFEAIIHLYSGNLCYPPNPIASDKIIKAIMSFYQSK